MTEDNRENTSLHTPGVPLVPQAVPQQRLHLVVRLPRRPKPFRVSVDYIEPMPEKHRPKGKPRKAIYLGATEWSWSPVHSRLDAYYLNSRGRYWLLWTRWLDENDFSWEWDLYAYAPKKNENEKTAAVYLLMDAWKQETERGSLDHYDFIDETGFLSVDEISEIARKVWPDESAED